MPRKKSTTTPTKKGSTSHEKGSSSRSKVKQATVTIEPAKTREKRSKRPTEPKQIKVVDKSRKAPQQIEVKIIYNPEKEVKYLMADMETKDALALVKRIWKFYRQLKKARKLEKKLQASRDKMVEALNTITNKEEDD